MKEKYSIIALGVLLIVFIGLLVYSTNNSYISVDTQFFEQVNMNEKGTTKLGETTIKNTGLLPKKVELQTYQACDQENRQYYLQYNNQQHQNFRNNIEISSNSEINLSIESSLNYFGRIQNITQLQLKIYEDTSETFFECQRQSPNDVIAEIEVTING